MKIYGVHERVRICFKRVWTHWNRRASDSLWSFLHLEKWNHNENASRHNNEGPAPQRNDRRQRLIWNPSKPRLPPRDASIDPITNRIPKQRHSVAKAGQLAAAFR